MLDWSIENILYIESSYTPNWSTENILCIESSYTPKAQTY